MNSIEARGVRSLSLDPSLGDDLEKPAAPGEYRSFETPCWSDSL